MAEDCCNTHLTTAQLEKGGQETGSRLVELQGLWMCRADLREHRPKDRFSYFS